MTDFPEDTCASILALLDDYVDRELTPADVERVERHLVWCAMCAREYRIEGRLLQSLRERVQRIAVPAELHARVWRRVQDLTGPGTNPQRRH